LSPPAVAQANVIFAVPMLRLSVVSTALNVSTPAVVDETENVTLPSVPVVAAAEILGDPGPAVLATLTFFPRTGFPKASRSTTVIVETALPLATTEVGVAVIELALAETGPAVKVT